MFVKDAKQGVRLITLAFCGILLSTGWRGGVERRGPVRDSSQKAVAVEEAETEAELD